MPQTIPGPNIGLNKNDDIWSDALREVLSIAFKIEEGKCSKKAKGFYIAKTPCLGPHEIFSEIRNNPRIVFSYFNRKYSSL